MNENNSIIQAIITLVILILYIFWKKYHSKEIRKGIKMNSIKIFSELWHALYAAGACIILLILLKALGEFAVVYIALPICVGLLYIFRSYDEKYFGFYCLLKGIYYLLLAIYSIWQYYSNSQTLVVLSIGFTISLAIFESIVALRDGIIKMRAKK